MVRYPRKLFWYFWYDSQYFNNSWSCRTYSKSEEKYSYHLFTYTAQKMKYSIKVFFSKGDQTRSFLRIWSHLLKKSGKLHFMCSVIKTTACHKQYMNWYKLYRHRFTWIELSSKSLFLRKNATKHVIEGLVSTATVNYFEHPYNNHQD